MTWFLLHIAPYYLPCHVCTKLELAGDWPVSSVTLQVYVFVVADEDVLVRVEDISPPIVPPSSLHSKVKLPTVPEVPQVKVTEVSVWAVCEGEELIVGAEGTAVNRENT